MVWLTSPGIQKLPELLHRYGLFTFDNYLRNKFPIKDSVDNSTSN